MDFTLCLAITFEMSPVINNCKKSISMLSRRKLHSLNQWERPASLYVEVNAHTPEGLSLDSRSLQTTQQH